MNDELLFSHHATTIMHHDDAMPTRPGLGGERPVNPWRIVAWSAAATVLLLPLIAMQFTTEVDWTVFDFVFAGVLLLGVGLAFEFAVRRSGEAVYRWAVGVALAAVLLLVWMNGAVGIIGGEGHWASGLLYAVPVVGLIWAFVARFEPEGMAHALVAMAVAHALVVGVALVAGAGGAAEVLVLNGGFIALSLGSAALFRRAARMGVT